MMGMSYDFSDLGGVPISANKYDFSDIGGKEIKAGGENKAPAQQPKQQPKGIAGNISSALNNLMAGAANTGQSIAHAFFPNNPATNNNFDQYFGVDKPENQMPYFHEAPGAALNAATFAPGLIGAAKGVGAGVDALRPTSMFRGNLSPEELRSNLAAAGNTETPLGDVINSPTLKRAYENFASRHFMSDADQKSANVQEAISNKGNDIVSRYLGDTSPYEVQDKIKEALQSASQEQQAMKNNLYNKAHKIADESGLKLELPTFSENAKKYSDLINDQNFLKFEPESKQLLNRLANYKNPVQVSEKTTAASKILGPNGEPAQAATTEQTLRYPSLKESNILAGKLSGMAKQYGASPAPEDRNMANVLGELGRSLKGDIKSSIDNSGNAELQNSFKYAEKNYKQNFVPFLDKDVYKFTNGGKDSEDILSTFIKTGGSTDKGRQLSKLTDKLSTENQNLVKYAYLSRSIKGAENSRSVDPNELVKIWKDSKLGINQKKALFPAASERAELDNFSNLAGMNKDSISRMANNPNGQRALEMIMHGMSSGTGATIGMHVAGIPGAIAGGAAAMAGIGAISRYMTNKLTDPAFRQKFVEAMIKRGQQ